MWRLCIELYYWGLMFHSSACLLYPFVLLPTSRYTIHLSILQLFTYLTASLLIYTTFRPFTHVYLIYILHSIPNNVPTYISIYIQSVNKYMLQRSVVDKSAQCDHNLLIHPCPEKLCLRARAPYLCGLLVTFT
jgi:hypothetical protein